MRTRVIVLLVVVLTLVVIFRHSTRPVPFDAAAWRAGDARLRFRMKDALLARHAAGELATRDQIDRTLGPDDDDRSNNGRDDQRFRYFRLKQWWGAPWYLRVTFDEAERVTRFMVAPD